MPLPQLRTFLARIFKHLWLNVIGFNIDSPAPIHTTLYGTSFQISVLFYF